VTVSILELVAANAVMLVLGAGLLPLMSLARTRRELVAKLPLAYAVGIAATGILAAELAIVDVPVGRLVLPLLAAAALAAGLSRLGRRAEVIEPRPAPLAGRLPGLAVLAVALAFLVPAARLFAVKPLVESDGWGIWALRARALYAFGHPTGPAFTSALYPALQHPLWLPAVEALDFRFLGRFDGTLVHLQLLGLAAAFVGGAWILLRDHAPPILLAATLLAVVTAPTFFNQLQTNFADVPLAILLGLGVAALAAWLASDEPGLLPAATLFLGAAAITKNEGELFALIALAVAAAFAGRRRLRPLGVAALVVVAIDLPWRIWVQVNHARIAEYSLANLFSPGYLRAHSDRVWPSAHELLTQIVRQVSWSYVVAFLVAGLLAAVFLRRFLLAGFAIAWLLLSFAGLVAIYWISTNPLTDHLYNSSDRTIDSLVIGGALLVPVLLGPARSRAAATDAVGALPPDSEPQTRDFAGARRSIRSSSRARAATTERSSDGSSTTASPRNESTSPTSHSALPTARSD
jgi:hypothetical protein